VGTEDGALLREDGGSVVVPSPSVSPGTTVGIDGGDDGGSDGRAACSSVTVTVSVGRRVGIVPLSDPSRIVG